MTDSDYTAVRGADLLDPVEIRSIQQRYWRKQAACVQKHSAYYQQLDGESVRLNGDLKQLAAPNQLVHSTQHFVNEHRVSHVRLAGGQ